MRFFAVLLAAALLAACSSSHPSAGNPRQAYLKVVRYELHATNHQGDADMLRYARFVCRGWGNGATWPDQLAGTTTRDVSIRQSGVLVRAATAAFCPQYRDKLPA